MKAEWEKKDDEEDEWECEHCGETLELEDDKIESEGFIKLKCLYCCKIITGE